MDIEIDPLSSTPIYQQIRDRIVEAIATGALRRGDVVTPVRRLAAAFGINPNTVAKAYDLLRTEGYLAANAKSGTFIACDAQRDTTDERFTAEWRARVFTLLAEARAHGMTVADVEQHIALVAASLAPVDTHLDDAADTDDADRAPHAPHAGDADEGPVVRGTLAMRGAMSGEAAR